MKPPLHPSQSMSSLVSSAVAPEQDVKDAATPNRLKHLDWDAIKPLPPANGVPPKEWASFLEEVGKEQKKLLQEKEQQGAQVAALQSDTVSTLTSYQDSIDDLYDTIDFSQRPFLVNPKNPDEKYATPVEVVFRVKEWSISKSNDHEFCKLEGFLEMHWYDYRLDNFPKNKKIPENTWRPEICASYGCNMDKAENYEEVPRFYYNTKRDGKVRIDCRFFFSGDGVNLGADLDRLRSFPFDSVRIDVSIFLSGSRRGELPGDLQVSFQRPNMPTKLVDNFSGKFQQFQWNTVKHSGDYELFRVSYGEGFLSRNWQAEEPVVKPALMFSVHLKRTPGFYLQKGILPLYLCAFFSLVTFLSEPIDVVGRLQMLFALFLTAFAIQWVTLERLPRLPFNTVLDDVVSHVVVSLMIAATGQGFSYRIAREAAQEETTLVDAMTLVDTRMKNFDFQIATIIDLTTAFVIVFYLIVYSYLKRFRTAWRQGKNLAVSAKNLVKGALRPWVNGKEYRNKAVRPCEGNCWRVDLTQEFTDSGSFLGMGVLTEAEEF
ncbi:unnamed protein product [Amoebophrya sp. A120]|nr:unnamed protein product [Amoebophrya sp. A120]|eukprot:GSA120T00020660001.1